MAAERFDAIVIGSGQGGNPLAKALAAAGRTTAIIEREHVGGSCVNVGCTPTKTMVASARVAYLARRAGDYGVRSGRIAVDMARVRQRKRRIVNAFRGGSERSLERTRGVTLLMGEAHFTGPKSVEVAMRQGGTRRLTADQIFINVGARPSRPPVLGLDRVPYLDSTSIMEVGTLPGHLVVLGGGFIGIEFGQMFRRFGSKVTIVQRNAHLLAREDPDVCEAVEQILRDDGITVLLETEVDQVARARGGIQVKVRTATPPGGGGGARGSGRSGTPRRRAGSRTLTGSHLLVATGRVPNTDRLNLTAAGVETDSLGYITVNERLETNVPGVYAVGDAKPGPAFTHTSYDDFRILEANLLKGGHATTQGRPVPYCVFMDPELGRVGMSETEARKAGRNIRVFTMPMRKVARAIEMDETRGLMKAVTDAGTNEILGCAMLGVFAGEMMSIVEVAMMGRLPHTAIRDAIFAHPTLAEALNNLFDQ